jgi:hypothetical protein
MIFTPGIISIYILNILFLIFGAIAFYISIKIYKDWDISKTTKKQYKLEKQSYLVATIIKYIFIVKLPLFLFFIFTIDSISNLLVGAMCGAGVIDAATNGVNLLVLKVINIYLFGFWIILHKVDISSENLAFTKMKFGLFIWLFILLAIEIFTEFIMFFSINPSVMVSCCGSLYSSTASTYISTFINIDTKILLSVFYMNFLGLLLSGYFKKVYSFSILNLIFIIVSIVSLISFFGTYIYELPTHHCPFCFLQKDYYYVGYLLYFTLFVGTFFGIIVPFFKKDYYFKYSIFFTTFYTIIVSLYPITYYIRNGVWLS